MHFAGAVLLHQERLVAADDLRLVVERLEVLVLLGVEVDLLLSRGVLDAGLVEAAAARAGVRTLGALRLLSRQS
jgi:hypothetical protein